MSADASEVAALVAVFDEAARVAPARVRSLVAASGFSVVARAKVHAPVDTGRLRNSIHLTMEDGGDSITAVIAASVHYAPYQEFGTSRMRAQPFMRPAFEEVAPQFEKAMQELGGDLL